VVSGHLLNNIQLVSNKNDQKETLDESQELGNSLTQLKRLHKLTFLSLTSVILWEEYYIKIRWNRGVFICTMYVNRPSSGTLVHKCL